MAKTVMVVDDEKDIRSTLKTILVKEGYKVILASNADEAIEKLKKNTVDLVLLDVMMPGTQVKEAIPKMKGVKIAMLTVVKISEAQKEHLLKNKNIVDFIQKPFDINALIKRIKKHLA